MKRLNPKTGLPFRSGDVREDGYIFSNYQTRLRHGFKDELWLAPNNFAKRLQRQKLLQAKHNATKTGHINHRLKGVKDRARKLNIPFNLTLEYLESIAPDNCPVFGTPLAWGKAQGKISPSSPSLDKINPNLGYVIGNVQWLSNLANTMKNKATVEQLKQFGEWAIRQSQSPSGSPCDKPSA